MKPSGAVVLLAASLVLFSLLWSVLWPFAGVPAGRVLGLLVLMAMALPVLSGRAAPADAVPASARAARATFAVGFAALAVALAALEWRQPFYFATDDNLAQFGPVMTEGCRSFFRGTFPTWNPYQDLGQPTTVTGVYALTYPVTYLSWLIAKFLLRNEGALVDVFCILHIAIGYLAMCRFLHQRLGIRPVVTVIAALSFGLSGFFLVTGRCWYYMVPLALWLPIIAERTAAAIRVPRILPALGAGVALGVFFHAGNAQMWVYAMMIFAIIGVSTMVYRAATGGQAWRTAIAFGVAAVVAVVVAAPLLIPQARFAADIPRSPWGSGIVAGLGSLLVPLPFLNSPHPNGWSDEGRGIHLGALYFIGTVTTLAALWSLGRTFRRLFDATVGRRRLTSTEAVAALLSVGLLVSLEFALGEVSWAWPAMSTWPVFSKFSNPFKFLPFVSLFGAALGAIGVEQLLRCLPARRAAALLWSLVAVTAVVTVCHVAHADSSFYTYTDKPWPSLKWPPALRRDAARVASLYPGRSNEAGYVEALGHNFSAIYEVPSLQIYDPLVTPKPESEHAHDPAHWQDYGITHVLQFGDTDALVVAQMNLSPVFHSGKVTVYSVPNPLPLAWEDANPRIRLVPQWRGNGFTIAGLTSAPTAGGNRFLHVNVLRRKGFVAIDDHGKRLSTERDPLGRMIIKLGARSTTVVVTYQPQWKLGYLLVLALLLLGVWCGVAPAATARWLSAAMNRQRRFAAATAA